MMRNTLFRGKRLDTGKWAEGYYSKVTLPGSGTAHHIKDEYLCHDHLVDPETAGQWTGIEDKEGKKIFEGHRVLDNVGREWIVRYSNRDAAFMFYWAKDTNQKQPYRAFNMVQRPLEILDDTPALLEETNGN